MEPVAPTSDTQQVNVLIHGCIDENDRTTLCFRTMWGTIFRPIPSPRRLFPNTRPFYVEYQFQGMKVGDLAPITEDSIHQLVIDAPTAPRLHRTLLIRDANFPTHWLIDAVDERYPRRLDPTSDLPFAQASSSTSSEQQATQTFSSTSEQELLQGSNSTATQAATAPAADADADGDALFTGPTSSPSSTPPLASEELSCSELLAFLAQDDPNVMAKGFALEAARAEEARETRGRQDELDREAQPAPAPAPEVGREPRSSTRLMAPDATTTTERSRSRSAYSSGDNSSGNDPTGTNGTASIEASASSLATIASYTSNGSPVNMEPWALNTDSPAASLHLVPPPSAHRPCPLQPYIDEYLRHRRRVGEVSFDRGLQNLMSPDGRVRTPQEVQRRHEEIERASELRQARRLEEMRSNRVALSHLPSLGAPGPSRRSGNEGDDERNSQSSKETTTSESSGAAESEKENVSSNDNNRQEDEENRGLGPSGTIRGRKGKGKERERSDDDHDEKKGESSSSPGKRRKSLPLWDGQK